MRSKKIKSNRIWFGASEYGDTWFGFLDDGLDDASFTDNDGDRWFKADEYGDRSYMWEYR